MAVGPAPRPRAILFRDLLAALCVAILAYVLLGFLELYHVPNAYVVAFEAGAVVLVAWLVARALTGSATALMAHRGDVSRAAGIRIFINLLVAIGAVLALFALAGVSIESIFLGSALAGIILGLAAQTVLANLFAGLILVVADPFRPGDRINLVSGNLGAMASSYPHEMLYPLYGGWVEDVGLVYTVLRQDSGAVVKIPNSIVLGGVVQHPLAGTRTVRVRMTFPQTLAVATVEGAVADLGEAMARSKDTAARLSLEVVDISASTWDGLVQVVTSTLDEPTVRDRVLRAVLQRVAPPPVARPTA